MKKSFSILLALFCSAAAVEAAVPSRSDLLTQVNSCYAVLQEFMANPETAVPPQVWQKARAVLIVNQFKGGFILGVKSGYGVVMVKKANGRWSLPVLVNANEASIGFQIGAKSVETIYIMTDDQTPRLLFKPRFNIGVDAKAVAGPHVADVERDNRPLLAVPVLVYTKERGLYAGATIKAAQIMHNDEANSFLYSTDYTLPELLYSDWVKPVPEVQPLMDYVQHLSP